MYPIHIDHAVELSLVLILNRRSYFHANVALEVFLIIRSQRANLLLLLQIGCDRLTSELALVHLQCEKDLAALFYGDIIALISQIPINLPRLVVEQKAIEDAFPSHICLMGLFLHDFHEDFKLRLKLPQALQAEVRQNRIDNDKLMVSDPLLVNQLQY